MNNVYVISSVVASIICWVLGFLVYIKNTHSITNKSFAVLLLSIGTWTLFPLAIVLTSDPQKALLYGRLVYISALFAPANFYWAISTVLENKSNKTNKIIIRTSYIISCLFLFIAFSNLFIKGVFISQPNSFVNPGPFYPVFVAIFGIVCILTFQRLYSAFKESTGAYKNQIKYVTASFIIAFVGGLLHVSAPYINMEIFPHDFLIILFAFIIAYTIIRYRLMDITIAIKNLLIYIIEVVVLSIFLFFLLGLFGFEEILPMVISSLGIAAGLIPLRTLIKRFVDKIIFKGKYDYQKALADITHIVPTIIDQDKLIKYITDQVTKSMHIEKAVVFLKDDRKDAYLPQYSLGLGDQCSGKSIDGKDALINLLKEREDVVLKYELYQSLPLNEVNKLWNVLKPFDTELVVPFHKGDNIIGLLCLSYKGAGDIFNQDDFRILQTIANESAVVIENIRLYNKLIHSDRQTFLETLASGVSHEMRNRLVAIRTFIDLFPERVDLNHVEKGFIEFRELAVREMARLTKIIDGLLSYSRAVTSGGEPLNMNDLFEEALLIIHPKLKEKEIQIETVYDKNIPSITGDKGRLLQVFINIMQNGIEAMKKEGKLQIKTTDKGENIEVHIADNGKGIPKDHLDAIFEPFFTTKHTGTGLGLSIVQRIVRDHNGTITVSSELNKGTTFLITFSKKGGYKPEEIAPKTGMGYWDVKKEYEMPETTN
jgi:signal transduction histidine kinase